MKDNRIFALFASLQSMALRHGLVARLEFCAGDTSPKDAWRCRVFEGEDLLACYTELDMEWRPGDLEGWLGLCQAVLAHVAARKAGKGGKGYGC